MSRWRHVGPTTPASLAAAVWRQEKDVDGACWECKAPAAPGRKRCERHLRIHREKEAKRRRLPQAINETKGED